jgi:beta-galactosidase
VAFKIHLANLLAIFVVLSGTLAVGKAQSSPRLRLRFDDNWKFHEDFEKRTAEPDAFKWTWQSSNAKSLDDSPNPTGDWKPYRTGQNVLHRTPEFGLFETQIGSGPLAGRYLHFESVDDNAQVYLNGSKVGRQIGYGEPFDLRIDRAWNPAGPNLLEVLVENTGGDGGINGSVTFEKEALSAPSPKQTRPAFNDSAWRTVHLPHDYVVEGKFAKNEETGHGSLPRNPAWYRKSFLAPPTWRGRDVWVTFDGVYRNSAVYLNGKLLGRHASGYIDFRHDLSKILVYGKLNVLAVHVDPRRDEGWWYEGGGIYRHVWMNVAAPVHIPPGGVFVRTESAAQTATLKVGTEVVNGTSTSQEIIVRSSVVSPEGYISAPKSERVEVQPGAIAQIDERMTVAAPQLWTLNHPRLYTLKSQILAGGKIVDEEKTSFGIRTILFDRDRGFLLNGRPVKIKGTCNHQDHAGVGIAMPDSLLQWRLTQLKRMGSNAYRCSHNPPAYELLDDCDRMGILVMDETRHLGDTSLPKSPRGTQADDLSELKEMIHRDRNHPSIVIWSLYNEEPLQGTREGGALFAKERAVVNGLDGTRPCSGATNWGYQEGIIDVTHLFGVNYNIGEYDEIHHRKPELPLFGSETASTLSTRGEYVNDPAKGYVSAYDVNIPDWGATAEGAWQALQNRPFMAGGFVWTGFDYKGEPTPYEWPCINSHFGIMDITGFPKDDFYYYQSVWGNQPLVHILPSWNGPVIKGKPVDVWAYSTGDSVELFLNGTSMGKLPMPHLGHVHWSVPFVPGVLEAKAYSNGAVVATDKVETTGAPASIRLKTSRTSILADGEDLTVVQVEILDAQGRVVPDSANLVRFSVRGAAKIGGVGNGDPSDHDPDQADNRKAFHGLCMVLVQSNGKSGPVELEVRSAGLRSARLFLKTTASEVH